MNTNLKMNCMQESYYVLDLKEIKALVFLSSFLEIQAKMIVPVINLA